MNDFICPWKQIKSVDIPKDTNNVGIGTGEQFSNVAQIDFIKAMRLKGAEINTKIDSSNTTSTFYVGDKPVMTGEHYMGEAQGDF